MSDITIYNVITSDAALAMLDTHIEFLAKVSTNAALNLMEVILSDIESLSQFPERFSVYENEFIAEPRYRKMLSAKRYLIIYEIINDTVFVDYIIDCRQDYDWLLNQI